jgi:hypothetical protein
MLGEKIVVVDEIDGATVYELLKLVETIENDEDAVDIVDK